MQHRNTATAAHAVIVPVCVCLCECERNRCVHLVCAQKYTPTVNSGFALACRLFTQLQSNICSFFKSAMADRPDLSSLPVRVVYGISIFLGLLLLLFLYSFPFPLTSLFISSPSKSQSSFHLFFTDSLMFSLSKARVPKLC